MSGPDTSRTRLTSASPMLPSLNFSETRAFYGRLDFSVEFEEVALLGMARDDVRLYFWLTGNRRIPASTSCWINVAGIAALHRACLDLGVVPRRGGLELKPWGYRAFDMTDCHGNRLRFCEWAAIEPAAVLRQD